MTGAAIPWIAGAVSVGSILIYWSRVYSAAAGKASFTAITSACALAAAGASLGPVLGLWGVIVWSGAALTLRGLVLMARAGGFPSMAAVGSGLALLVIAGGPALCLVVTAVPLMILADRRTMVTAAPAAFYAVVLFPPLVAWALSMHLIPEGLSGSPAGVLMSPDLAWGALLLAGVCGVWGWAWLRPASGFRRGLAIAAGAAVSATALAFVLDFPEVLSTGLSIALPIALASCSVSAEAILRGGRRRSAVTESAG